MAYVYAKTPVYTYATFNRENLQFTHHPVFQVYNPPPPDASPPPDEKAGESAEPQSDPPEGEGTTESNEGGSTDG